jgi:recombination protein RecR
MDPINKLIELFSEFPGIGPRQAKRFVYYLLRHNNGFLNELSSNISSLKKTIGACSVCFQYFQKKTTSQTLCPICSDSHRDQSELMIISHDVDLEHVEKSGVYKGTYFVLGGVVPILAPNPEERIRSRELLALVKKQAESGALKEIIIAMNVTPEGENTEQHLSQILSPITTQHSIKISHLGRGVSTGTEIEYSDKETLKNALQNRK